ncbi:MAG: hypothetical protein H6719_20680 [Sandaracinaceae bacterium]|nr:hypothetical protein [Sandaracinaceae bacterium]
MSAAAQIAKLEALLERIQSNRGDAPTPYTGSLDAAPDVEATMEAPLDLDEPLPTPEPAVPASALIAAPRRAQEPTPMERAVSTELDLGPADEDDDDEPELEISYPEPDEPALLLEVDDPSESTPTAPVHTRAPDTVRPEPAPEPDVLLDSLPPEPEPQLEVEPQPERIELAVAAPSAPIAKVVARPKPKTFGELLDRALALRPR